MRDLLFQLMRKNGFEKESPDQCRERRRRRIRIRARQLAEQAVAAAKAATAAVPLPVNANRRGKAVQVLPELESQMQEQIVMQFARPRPPVDVPGFGTMTVIGRSRDMEDAISVQTTLCCPAINGNKPVHFFGVYDGHGGAQVAALCRERMHVLLEAELTSGDHTVNNQTGATAGGSGSSSSGVTEGSEEWKAMWSAALKSSFIKLDEEALTTCTCGSIGMKCNCPTKVILDGGSTAVVAVMTAEHIIVANCGDSRAVLSRGGKAIPMSVDQKPDRPDEYKRIIAAGGRVVYLDTPRVEGILAMSRAIGDRYLKPGVIPEPEILFLKRDPQDECLILATDGMWDVVDSELACVVASECLLEDDPTNFINEGPLVENDVGGSLFSSQSVLAAAILTRFALARNSYDNISVIVVDLMRG